ncbi:bifunctional riboflavin kinase/FAD synthetase [Moraxella oblonga]|uniref:bifunctional riboflavin kinase/FAD synthetase n=1 Tax=Moraxella oblonga TaxID=200413 RepID=UPI00083433C3|nr:bifunctional riboflavin kinase/FAD synthetase [Moraxella oblonga]
MQIIHLDPKNPTTLPSHVLTIGNFDGVHLGHQAMLNSLKTVAQHLGLATAVMVFEPQPREFFNPQNPPARLTNFAEKIALLDRFGVEMVIQAKFNDTFRHLSAHDFANLLKTIGTHHLVLGDDFRFGHDRMGDKVFLQGLGFGVDDLPTVTKNNLRISSTAVREALAQGDLAKAKGLLGQDYAITGQVVHGDKIGRTLNFPTANITLNRLKPALHGVFAVDVMLLDDTYQDGWQGLAGLSPNSLFGCANIGTRPSVHGTDWRLEVHLPNFCGDLYGQTLTVKFLHFLHGERHYQGLDDLKNGIRQDVNELLNWRTLQLRKQQN